MREFDKIREFLGTEPLKRVENPESLSLEEMFRLFLPDSIPEGELGKQTLLEFFIREYKGETEKYKGETEEARDMFQDLVIINDIMGEEFLPSLISTFRELDKYMRVSGEVLTPEGFRNTVRNMVYGYRVRLDAKDLRILNVLKDNVFMTVDDLAEKVSMSYTTVFRRKKRLENRCRLGVVPRLNYSKIGLSNLLVLVEGEAHVDSPYLLSRHELLGGDHYTMFSIAIPHRALKQVREEFKEKFPRVWIWRMYAFESVLSFDFYDVDAGDWDINWDYWAHSLNNVLSKGWDQVIPQKMGKPPSSDIFEKEAITERDLKLIDALMEKFEAPIQKLSEEVEYGMKTVARDKARLLERGIIEACLSIDHVGLNEHILLIVESDIDTLYSFAAAIRRLPKAWIYWMRSPRGTSSLACWLEAPRGSITPLERVIRWTLRPLAEYKLFFRSIQEGSRGLLLKLFDPQSQTWRMEPEILRVKKSKVTL